MKKLGFNLAVIILTVGMLAAPYRSFSQDFSNEKKITKKEQKEARKAELYQNFKAIDTLLQNKTFVLEAEFLQGRYGSQVPVSSNINFIRVHSPSVVLQTGTNNYVGTGYNGLGGITAEGSLNNYKVTSDKKHMNHTVWFSTTTQVGTYDVLLRISANASATATITGLSRGSITYRGNLVAPYNSRVYKGRNSL
ncbi:MAG: DUF4251 domain-containing protein [Chloroflexota bacterium]